MNKKWLSLFLSLLFVSIDSSALNIINHKNNLKYYIDKSNNQLVTPTLSIQDYRFDETPQNINNLEAILEEAIDSSSDGDCSIGIPSEISTQEIVPCSYSNFKSIVYNSNKTNEEIYSLLKNAVHFSPESQIEQESNTETNGVGPDISFDEIDVPEGNPVKEITIFTAGIGGNASDWSNNGTTLPLSNFYLNSTSLPYKIKNKYNSNVVVATPLNNNFYYSRINTANSVCTLSTTNTISTYNINNNDVILFNYNDTLESNQIVYNKFRTLANEIKNKYPLVKFNLIGHSRGGLINAMYANEYPSNIDKMYSIGTPYFENDLAEIATAMTKIANLSGINWLDDFVNSQNLNSSAYNDMANMSLISQIRNNLNTTIKDYNISLLTIGHNFCVIIPIVINFYFFKIRIDIEIEFNTDGLVNTFKSQGVDSDPVYNTIADIANFLIFNPNTNYSENLTNNIKKTKTYRFWELLYIQKNISDNYEDRNILVRPNMLIAAPHNLQTMDIDFHNDVLNTI